jgi:hypothetical protein
VTERGGEDFEERDEVQFLPKKNIALSMNEARFMCCERVPGQLSELQNLKSMSVYFLAF